MYVEKLPKQRSYQKFVRKNVDEIDTKLSLKMMLDLKVVKINMKIIIMLLYSKSVTHSVRKEEQTGRF